MRTYLRLFPLYLIGFQLGVFDRFSQTYQVFQRRSFLLFPSKREKFGHPDFLQNSRLYFLAGHPIFCVTTADMEDHLGIVFVYMDLYIDQEVKYGRSRMVWVTLYKTEGFGPYLFEYAAMRTA